MKKYEFFLNFAVKLMGLKVSLIKLPYRLKKMVGTSVIRGDSKIVFSILAKKYAESQKVFKTKKICILILDMLRVKVVSFYRICRL